jgi:hypothetical protein
MTIYKVQHRVNKKTKTGNKIDDESSIVIIDNLKTAKYIFELAKNAVRFREGVVGYSGKAELFIPRQHEDGILANEPNNNKYIEQYIIE